MGVMHVLSSCITATEYTHYAIKSSDCQKVTVQFVVLSFNMYRRVTIGIGNQTENR